MVATVREDAVVSSYGGEEFVVVAPETDGLGTVKLGAHHP